MASMASAEGSDILHCPICYEVFENPRAMPCLHTYCYKCLENLCMDRVRGSDLIDCPICRKKFIIPSEGVDGFPHNFYLQQIADGNRADAAATTKSAVQDKGSIRPKSTTSAISHVIVADEERKGSVTGVTVHGDELFIVRWNHRESECKGLIEVHDATSFTFKRNIKVKEFEQRGFWYGLASCDANNCLYANCWYVRGQIGYIVRVDLTGNNDYVKWQIKDGMFGQGYMSMGLSVNSEHNVVVVCSCGVWSHLLLEYTTRGELLREINLQDDVEQPNHAIQLNSSQFVVSHSSGGRERVCLVSANGKVLSSYGDECGSEIGQLDTPHHLAVDSNGFIYVADRINDRIVVLDSSLKWSRDVQFDGGSGVKKPSALYLDEQRNLLFVGEWFGDDSRVFVVTL